MPRPGFYNDNEYRAYPFVFKPGAAQSMPDSAIVDAGVIMRLDSNFDDKIHTVWLSSVTRDSDKFYFEFKTNAADEPIQFSRKASANTWEIEYAESADRNACENVSDPVWEGFLVTGPLNELNKWISADDTITFHKNVYQLEPARIQNLNHAYVRSVNIGNYDRVIAPNCGDTTAPPTQNIVLNRACMTGDLRFKEGYNCSIRQSTFANEIIIGASVGAGARVDDELCANGSELALFTGEPLFAESKFFSGGPACDELIFTVNGLGGPAVTLTGVGGINVSTKTDPPRIVISRNPVNSKDCAQS